MMQLDNIHMESSGRIIVASGMQGTGCSTIASHVGSSLYFASTVDAGSVWSHTIKLCTTPFLRVVLVSTADGVSISSAYALIKLLRDHLPHCVIDMIMNRCGENQAMKAFERIQHATTKFLDTKVNFGGFVPLDETMGEPFHSAISEIANRIDNEIKFGCFIGY